VLGFDVGVFLLGWGFIVGSDVLMDSSMSKYVDVWVGLREGMDVYLRVGARDWVAFDLTDACFDEELLLAFFVFACTPPMVVINTTSVTLRMYENERWFIVDVIAGGVWIMRRVHRVEKVRMNRDHRGRQMVVMGTSKFGIW
jgi:hypothetical protein